MLYRFKLIQDSIAIAVLLDMEEITEFDSASNVCFLRNNLYLRIADNINILRKEVIEFWAGSGIRDFFESNHLNTPFPVCYLMTSLEFLHSDFQEEALYYAAQEWLGIQKGFKLPIVNAHKGQRNRVVFPDINHLWKVAPPFGKI